MYTDTDALRNFRITDSVANLRQVYIIQEEKRKILFFHLYRERFHLFGLTILLTDFHSVVKIERKNLSKC